MAEVEKHVIKFPSAQKFGIDQIMAELASVDGKRASAKNRPSFFRFCSIPGCPWGMHMDVKDSSDMGHATSNVFLGGRLRAAVASRG
jgi:hypothetical protein